MIEMREMIDMRNAIKRGIAATGMAGALLLGTMACSAGAVEREDVATTAASALREQGAQVENMTCPSDLQAAVGQSLRCEFTSGGQPVDAVVTVRSIEGNTARYDVHTEARPVAKTLLARKVGELISQEAGVAVDTSDCAGDLQPRPGQSVSCDVSADGETAAFTVTVTSIDGGLVNFAIEQV